MLCQNKNEKMLKKFFFVELSPYYVWCFFFKRGHFFCFLSQLWLFFFLYAVLPKKKFVFPLLGKKFCFKTFFNIFDDQWPKFTNESFFSRKFFFPIKSLVSFAFIWKLNETWQFSMNLPKMTYKDVLPYSCFMVKNKQKTNNLKKMSALLYENGVSHFQYFQINMNFL